MSECVRGMKEACELPNLDSPRLGFLHHLSPPQLEAENSRGNSEMISIIRARQACVVTDTCQASRFVERLAVVVPSLRPLIGLDALGKREDPRYWHCTAIAFRQSMRSNRATETVAP